MSYPAPLILDNVELNAEGILKLQANQKREAIEIFANGLRSVIATIQVASDAEDDANLDINTQETGIPLDTALLLSVELPQHDTESQCEDDSNSNDGFTVYNRALQVILPLDDSMSDNSSSLSSAIVPGPYCRLLCGVFLYNLGLTYHRIAMETGKSTFLTKALDFYFMSHRTMRHEDGPSSVELSNLAFLALANNIGHIQKVRGNHAETILCADEIFVRLSFLWSSSPEYGAVMDPSMKRYTADYRVFMLNASFFWMTDRMPAQAA